MSTPRPALAMGLQARFLSLLLLGLLVTTLVLGFALGQQRRGHEELTTIGREAVRESAKDGVRRRGEAIASQIAEILANPLYYFDLQRIGEIADSTLRQADVAYVLVYDADGRIVHDGSDEIPTFGQPMTDTFAFTAVRARTLTVQTSEQVVDVAVPIQIGSESIGGVRVGISLEGPLQREAEAVAVLDARSQASARRSLWLLSGLFAVLLGCGLVLWLLIGRALVRPIRGLADAARAVEGGRFELDLPSDRGDELGELQRGFARMAATIGKHNEDVRRLAYNDQLTGLPNRLAFRELLDGRLITAHAGGGRLALVFVDLDDFKRVNDTLGHDAGDEVLEQFAARFRQCLPKDSDPQANVARFGGDEFAALVGADDARDCARQLAEAVLNELQRPMAVRGRQVHIGASIGITVFPEDALESQALLKNGDIAMYQAKSAGKNCMRFYSRIMDQAVETSVELEGALRGAWERGELSLRFQPIYELANGRLVGAEALLRWKHPTLGDIQPSTFIEIAEQSGLIDGIGRHVLRTACATAKRWATGGGAPFVSVNVSARQLRAGDLPEVVAAALRDTGLQPDRLHIELTETAVLGNELHDSVQLARLRAMGVKIWLDDFGTGFSGLSHLRRVPVDGLKIDKSFVADVLKDPDDLALTSAIIALAHTLGITAVAEGLESEAQFEVLRERGCDFGQGYWLGYPMPDADISLRMGT